MLRTAALPWCTSSRELVGHSVPLFEQVFSMLTRAYGAVLAMADLRPDVTELEKPLQLLAQTLWQAFRTSSQHSAPSVQVQRDSLNVLFTLMRVAEFLLRYKDKGAIENFLHSADHDHEVEDIKLALAQGTDALSASDDAEATWMGAASWIADDNVAEITNTALPSIIAGT